MNLPFQEFLFSVMHFSIGKMILKNKFENRFFYLYIYIYAYIYILYIYMNKTEKLE